MGRICWTLLSATAMLACGNISSGAVGEAPPSEGEMLYNTNCAMCHGRQGDLGMSGAKDLVNSVLTYDEVVAIVTQGKNGMMPYGGTLSKKQIEAVSEHVLTLRSDTTAQ